ncbi:MAG: response regulator [Desulfobacteraceae bacterium]|nr:response regulator [Desulfobacteraceae bacterium]
MKILIVDDHEENLYLLDSMLKAGGHRILAAANGEEAWKILEAEGIDLIISDILMPVMDGFQFCRKVKTDQRLRTIPFIIYTATYTGAQDQAFAMTIGADRFIEKPCEPEVFMAAVHEVTASAGRSTDIPAPVKEEEALRLYSERLIRKLEQKMLEAEREIQARKESESRFRLFTETAPVGVIIANQDQKAIYLSPKCVDLFGYTLDDIPNIEAWLAFAYPDEALKNRVRSEWQAEVATARATLSEIRPLEYPVTCKNGRVREIEFRMSTNGDLDFIVLTDITQRKQAEAEWKKLQDQLTQAQKMESVGRLAGGVAHDYNNMLSVIIGYAELALDKLKPGEPLYDDLTEILTAARRSADITRQLLAFARQQTIAPKIIDLNQTIQYMLKMMKRLIGEDIKLTWLPGTDLGKIKIDPSQIDQILANLCVNARDAIAGVGKITIETRTVRFDKAYCDSHAGFIPGDFIMLAVSDDGSGMDKEIQDRIFEPFFTTKRVGEGTGLGLSTVYGIVKQNDGFINVYSEPGKGTTFRIYLARHSGPEGESCREEMREIPLSRGETILLVEDEAAILKMAERILKDLGYTVLSAISPLKALDLAKTHGNTIHLLITDMVLPEMNGKDLARQVQSVYPEIKILFMSGYTANVIAHHHVLEPGLCFLQKPFSVKDMAVKAREALENT